MNDKPEDTKPNLRLVADHDLPDEDDKIEPAVNDEAVQLKISQLEEEHRDLDHAIITMEERMPYDRLTLQRMKKRKLALKDKIAQLQGSIHPDIIA